MTKNHRRLGRLSGFLLTAALLLGVLPCGHLRADEPSKVEAMLQVLNSENTEMSLREAQAQALLLDPQAYPALIDILQQSNNLTAKIIICKAIATRTNHFLTFNSQTDIPDSFTEPLFTALRSENPELAKWAAQALAKLPGDLTRRLTELILDDSLPVHHRLAGISTLQLLPGKSPILALEQLLDDPNPQLNQQAAAAIQQMLALPDPVTAQSFRRQYLPALKTIDEKTFLRRQLELQHKQLLQANEQIQRQKTQADTWRKAYLDLRAREFSAITDPDQKLLFITQFLQESSEDSLRIWALEQINIWCRSVNVQSKPVAAPLVNLLSTFIADPNPAVRAGTAEALNLLSEKSLDTADALLEQLETETQLEPRVALLKTLGTFEHVPALDQALVLLQSEQKPVVIEAARTLGRISVSRKEPVSDYQIETVAQQLAQAFHQNPDYVEVRSELIIAMGKIAAEEKYRPLAETHFGPLLEQALADVAAEIRSPAVDALAKLQQAQVLTILLNPSLYLLDDPDSGVRQDVVTAIKDFGDKTHLTKLSERFIVETIPDVASAIVSAYTEILNRLTTSDAYDCALAFKNGSDAILPLRAAILNLLEEKIKQDRKADRKIPPDFELELYSQKADLAKRQNQPAEAAQYHLKLLKLPELSPQDKDRFGLLVLTYAIQNPQDQTFLLQTQPVVKDLLSRPTANDALNEIANSCETLLANGNGQLLQAAQIVSLLIVPHQDLLLPEAKTDWQKLRSHLAKRLIDQQLALLADGNGNENPEAIRLLTDLDARLKDYPPLDATLEKRKAALQNFLNILQSPPPLAPRAPKPLTTIRKPNTQDS